MEKDLFTYDELLDSGDEYIIFGGVKFIRDFGPIKSGATFVLVNINYNPFELCAYLEITDETLLFKVALTLAVK